MFHVQYLFLVIKIYFCIRHDERKKQQQHYFVVKMSIAPICVKTQKSPKHRKQVLTV